MWLSVTKQPPSSPPSCALLVTKQRCVDCFYFFKIYFVNINVFACVCLLPIEVREGVPSSGTGVIGMLLSRCWELNLGHHKCTAFLTGEPFAWASIGVVFFLSLHVFMVHV